MRRLFEWALTNLATLPADLLPPWTSAASFVMHMLGQVGDESTAGRLQTYVRDPKRAASQSTPSRTSTSDSLPNAYRCGADRASRDPQAPPVPQEVTRV